jgi:hypothetical protein
MARPSYGPVLRISILAVILSVAAANYTPAINIAPMHCASANFTAVSEVLGIA